MRACRIFIYGVILMVHVLGCATSEPRLETSSLEIQFSSWSRPVELSGNGISTHTMVDKRGDGSSSDSYLIEAVYQVMGSSAEVQHLWNVLAALKSVNVPVIGDEQAEQRGSAVIRACRGSQEVAELVIPAATMDAYPLWSGVFNECMAVAHRDLVRGLFDREIAEMLSEKDCKWLACQQYEDAIDAVLRWRRSYRQRQGWFIIDDSFLLRQDIQSHLRAEEYDQAMAAYRQWWPELISDVRVNAIDGCYSVHIDGIE